MKRLLLVLAAFALGLAQAQVVRNFTSRYNTNTQGDILLIGNTLMTCSTASGASNAGQCANARNGTGSPLNNNDFTMVYVDADTDPSTFNSSSATLSLPAGATVLWAGLYWGAEYQGSAPPSPAQVGFRTPAMSGYQTLTATQTDYANSDPGYIRYQRFAEVTSLVQAGGSGTYWVANVQATQYTSGTAPSPYAGWSLVVVYQRSGEPLRHLRVYDGFAAVTSSNPSVSITVSGFITPLSGPVNARLGMVAYEGDLGTKGDSVTLNSGSFSATLSNAVNPADNFFNSTISDLGAYVSGKTPNYINQLGFDIDRLQVSGLPNGATSATFAFQTGGDWYYPGVFTFAIDLYAPDLTTSFTKTVQDLNGGNVVVGDVLEYTVGFTNTGGDGATNVVLRDPIPSGTQYVPGSLRVVQNAAGAPTGTFTDAAGDDIAEYSSACSELPGSPPCVRFRLGTGANATQGGLILPTQGATVRFRVQVLPSAAGQTLTNTARVDYNSQTLGTAFSQAASASASASVPTPPGLAKAFSPGSIPVGSPSTLTLTLSNSNAAVATLTSALIDNLPAGLVVASSPAASTTCPGGSVTAAAGSSSVSLGSGAQIPAGGTCTVSVQVTSNSPGSYTNTLPAGALQTDLGNSPNPASATLTVQGVTLSGRIYQDQQPNAVREPSEDWSGGPTVYVNLVQGGSVVQSVAVSAGTGSFTFNGVVPGSYTLVVTNSASATTPTPPAGWLFVEPMTGSRSLSVSTSNIGGQDFGLFNGSRVSGRVFYDDGEAGGTANNALQDGGERGVPGVTVSATQGANTRTALTDTSGDYTLWLPASLFSAGNLTLSHPQNPATGSNVAGGSVTLASSFADPAARQRTLTFANGQSYAGYNFGLVRESRLYPNSAGQAPSPGTITYSHLYRPGTLGSVTLSQSGGSFTYQARLDANCNGSFDPGEDFQNLPLSFSVGSSWPREADGSLRACALELRGIIPAGKPVGSVDIAQLGSSLVWAGNPSVSDPRTLTDTTTVQAPGELTLSKQVRNCGALTNPNGTCSGSFSTSALAKPGEVLEYCIAYRNQGTQTVTQVVITDPIPFFSAYVTGSLRLNGTILTDGADADAGEVSSGLVVVRVGSVSAGGSGEVCYRVKIL
ncbi:MULTISPECIES: DUF11 domain-containing protein [unclassified Meiothermus]|uniref:DUF7933 domain-containing protein n=1 Tax=unclassified Meiothermus TaxID=370471 RepID=UPI000D7BA243|nr:MULTISPECIES: DUF11 domain-containing protein [unclassified Meiothermus]PZA08210.1 hypothetical protein DNA98_03455 [Meiothermus sp. Pnk-1]RYM39405.1 DUF11 domain-containing protein [Meiothermus sp. PNK-Is4]